MAQRSAERKTTLSVLSVTDPFAETSDGALAISSALADAGHLVLGVRAGDASLPEAMARLKPDMVVVKSDSAVRDVLEHIVMATRDARRPIVMFTNDGDRPTMRSALGAGVTAYVVKGLQPDRAQAVIDVAVERFAGEQALRTELDAARNELADRKTIDRAKRLLMGLLMWEGLVDRAYIDAHTTGFDALRDIVRNCTPGLTAQVCGIKEADLVQAARWFGQATPTLSLYCQGLNQSVSGTDKNAALINLHLATGQIGKAGAGPFSLTGQPNAMGGREVGGLANLLSAHRDLANPQHRAEVAALWGVDSVPDKPGKSAVEMFQAAADGEITALWIACTKPAQSMPDQATVRRALQRCELVIVQEAFATTATAAYADLLLPATTWGEKDGTGTNSERRISRVRPAVAAPGEARHDWHIAVEVARRIEALLPARRAASTAMHQSLFPFPTPESVWNEHRESTRDRDLDITGMSYAVLDSAGPQQWPLREGEAKGLERLYADGQYPTADGRAAFAAVAARPLAEKRDAPYPFSLNTGRLRDHWHGLSRTGTLGRLYGHVAEPGIDMHPSDLARLRITAGDLVQVKSRRGTLVLPAVASTQVAPAQAFIAMHWGDEVLGSRHSGGVNVLTSPAFCLKTKQPELKHAAVKISKTQLPWQLLARAWLPASVALRRRAELLALCSGMDDAACMPFGREPGAVGVLLRAGAAGAPDTAWLAQVEALLGLDAPDVLRYTDPRRGPAWPRPPPWACPGPTATTPTACCWSPAMRARASPICTGPHWLQRLHKA